MNRKKWNKKVKEENKAIKEKLQETSLMIIGVIVFLALIAVFELLKLI